MRHWMMALALLCGTVACSHESLARPQSSFDKAKGEFSAAYESIKSGASQTATAGKLALRGVGSGAVEITDRSKEALGKSGGKADDAWITTKVKTELAMAEGVKSGDVHVGTERGIVTLKGTVDDAAAAKHAIQTALDVKGVAAVHSELAYPTERVAPKIYTKKPGY